MAHQSSYCIQEADFVCVEVLRPSQPNGVMSSVVSLTNHTFTGQKVQGYFLVYIYDSKFVHGRMEMDAWSYGKG